MVDAIRQRRRPLFPIFCHPVTASVSASGGSITETEALIGEMEDSFYKRRIFSHKSCKSSSAYFWAWL